MASFAEQLARVRKNRNMTQEELACAVNISRSRISRWENGNALPDIETVRFLSKVLQYDFVLDKDIVPGEALPENQELGAEESKAETEQPVEKAHCCKKKRALWIAVGCGVILLAAVLTAVLWPKVPQHEPFSLAWYQQVDKPKKGQAFVAIAPAENPTKAILFDEFPDGAGWFYTFSIEETNGVSFTVEKITVSTFDSSGFATHSAFDAETAQQAFGSNTLRTGMRVGWSGGFPLQDVAAVGLALEGTDANGQALTFHGHTMLSTEINMTE